jgi:hypothetical protein
MNSSKGTCYKAFAIGQVGENMVGKAICQELIIGPRNLNI